MSTMIEQMLSKYNIENLYNHKNAMKESMQEIVLCGLSRAGFFKEAAFYGSLHFGFFTGLTDFRKT